MWALCSPGKCILSHLHVLWAQYGKCCYCHPRPTVCTSTAGSRGAIWFGHMQQPVYVAHILIIESLEVDTTWSPIYTMTNEDTSRTWLCMVLTLSKLWNIHSLMVPSTEQEAGCRPLRWEAVQILESTDWMLLKSSFKVSSHLSFSWAPIKAETVTDYGVKMAQVSRILYHSICTVLVGEIPFNLDIVFLCSPLALILIP